MPVGTSDCQSDGSVRSLSLDLALYLGSVMQAREAMKNV